MISIREISGSCQAGPGILAAALYELRDFGAQYVPATGKKPACVVSTCPVCTGEPGALGSLRVEVVDVPPRLSWHCSLHNGGFNGVAFALSKHRAARVSELALPEIPIGANSDTSPEVDPVPDHQKELRCSNQRLILHHIKDLGHLTAMPVRCRHCVGCASWLKARRVSRLTDASSNWSSVHMVGALGATAFASLSRSIRRHGAEYAAVPLGDGRTVLTNDATVGERIEPGDVSSTIALLVSCMTEGRISCSVTVARKPQEKANLARERVGVVKLSEREVAAICLRRGVPVVRAAVKRGRKPLPTWDVSALSPDELLGLWSALGIDVTRGRCYGAVAA